MVLADYFTPQIHDEKNHWSNFEFGENNDPGTEQSPLAWKHNRIKLTQSDSDSRIRLVSLILRSIFYSLGFFFTCAFNLNKKESFIFDYSLLLSFFLLCVLEAETNMLFGFAVKALQPISLYTFINCNFFHDFNRRF